MKKIIFTLAIIFVSFINIGQTILNSHPLNLRNSRENHQILNAVNSQNQVYVFATDKENTSALKYTNYLFFADSLKIDRPNKEYEFMSGFSFDEKGNPSIYWTTENFKKILSVGYDFEKKSTKTTQFNFVFKDETILNTFSFKDNFYIVSHLQKEPKLKLYVFNETTFSEKTIDFSAFKFTNEKGKSQTFSEKISQNNLDFVDTKFMNNLLETVGKSKLYVEDNNLFLTFDSVFKTQLFQINLDDFRLSQQLFLQPTLQKSATKSNSFLYKNKLYQITTNKEEITVASSHLNSGEIIQKHYANSNDTISFRNSPFLSQTGNQKVRFIKNSKKYLQRLQNSEIGITVYKTPNSDLVTVGGVRNVNSTGDIILGITAGIAVAAAGNGNDIGAFLGDGNLQTNFFESTFTDTFEPIKTAQNNLAADYISQFLTENKVSLQNVFPFENFYILSYYDAKKKEIVLRKFEDVTN